MPRAVARDSITWSVRVLGRRNSISSTLSTNLFARINRYHRTSTPAAVNDFLFLTICCSVLQLFVINVNMAMLSFARLLLSNAPPDSVFGDFVRDAKMSFAPSNVLKTGQFLAYARNSTAASAKTAKAFCLAPW